MILQIMGRLGGNPEMRYTPEGEAVTSISVAEDRKWTDKNGNEHKKLWWFRCTIWGDRAESLNKWFKKGQGIYIVGELLSDEKGNPKVFQRKDGTMGASFEVSIKEWRFVPCDKDADNNVSPEEEPEEPSPASIPFNS